MKILRFIQAFMIILVLATVFPLIYDAIFSETKNKTNLYYSQTLNEFLIADYNKSTKKYTYKTQNGKSLNLDEFMRALPFKYYNFLLEKNEFPFEKWANKDLIKTNSQNLNIKPSTYNQKKIQLFTIFEANPKYLKLNYNSFAISNLVKFINLQNLSIDENLSQNFIAALKNANFNFPFAEFYNNPTTKKPFDEGVFLSDFDGKIYHLKMINSLPFVKDTNLKNIDFMLVSENPRKEFYAAIIDKNGFGLISYDDYKIIRFDNLNYNPKNMEISLDINPLNKFLTIKSSDFVEMILFDYDYNELKRFKIIKEKSQFLKVKPYIFAFWFDKDDSYKFKLKFNGYFLQTLGINLILMLFYIAFRRKKINIFKAAIIAFGGIYGVIAILVI
ncbi:MAG: DUF4857 domain-containing protein [Campylobacter sp.]|nr:DUF4857 domain-containing protein [Campylobacter sp.]